MKTNASDIFSLGRVFLFMMLPKESFLKFLFIPITSSADTLYLENTILNQDDLIGLIYRMIKMKKLDRIQIQQIRTKLDILNRNLLINMNSFAQTEIERIATQNLSPELIQYISDLDHISWVNEFFEAFRKIILSHLSFDVLSSATTLGQQKQHLSLMDSNISKEIHDQGKIIFILTTPLRFLRWPMNRERSIDKLAARDISKNF